MKSSSSRPRLRDAFRAAIRTRGYSHRTEKTYWYWIRYFVRFHDMRHPRTMGSVEVRRFLSWLAVERDVAASTQNQALSALIFLYDRVLEHPLGDIGNAARAKRPRRLPAVLTHGEAVSVLAALEGPYRLAGSLMYGAGLRVVEAARLRIKDIDLSQRVITVRDGKGSRDRATLVPDALHEALAGC